MRVKMWRKREWREIFILTVLTAVPVIHDWITESEISWHLIILWVSLSLILIVPKQIMSYARELDNGMILLKESFFSKSMLINRADISSVELYEINREPIGLKIISGGDLVFTFATSRIDPSLLEEIRSFIQKDKI